MKVYLLLLPLLVLSGCDVPEQKPEVKLIKRSGSTYEPDFIYYHDTRTDMCFLGGRAEYVQVSCSPKVLALTDRAR